MENDSSVAYKLLRFSELLLNEIYIDTVQLNKWIVFFRNKYVSCILSNETCLAYSENDKKFERQKKLWTIKIVSGVACYTS